MKRDLRPAGWLLLIVMGLALMAWGQAPVGWATITGRVLDSEGRPVPAATISVFPMDVAVSGGMPGTTTDQEGRYRLHLPAYPGKTRLSARKESVGYPDTQGLLFASGKESMPEVKLTPGVNLEGINIHLGAPDGILEGVVTDAKTHTPVSKARITLHRDEPESIYSTSLGPDGQFLFALPPVPIEITVSAPGYLRWTYKDPETLADHLVLNATAHRIITVELTEGN
jgi:hypothetical protein